MPDPTHPLQVVPAASRGPNALVVALLSVIATVLVMDRLRPHVSPTPAAPDAPAVAVDTHFLSLGKAYLPQLGATYAAAWEKGAKLLDAGQPLSTALSAVGWAWNDGRTKLFDRMATPEFARVIPESQKDEDVTPAQRIAMAAAWRGFARGLSGGKGPALFVPLSSPSAKQPPFVGRPRLIADLLASPHDAQGDAAPRPTGGPQ